MSQNYAMRNKLIRRLQAKTWQSSSPVEARAEYGLGGAVAGALGVSQTLVGVLMAQLALS